MVQAAATSYTPAAAGTIYTRLGTSTFSETLIADNRGQGSGTRVGATVLTDSTPLARPLQSVSVLRGARLLLSGGTVNATRGLVMDGSGSLVVGKGATLQLPSVYTLTNANVSVTDGGKLGGVRSLVVGAGAILTLDSTGATAGAIIINQHFLLKIVGGIEADCVYVSLDVVHQARPVGRMCGSVCRSRQGGC